MLRLIQVSDIGSLAGDMVLAQTKKDYFMHLGGKQQNVCYFVYAMTRLAALRVALLIALVALAAFCLPCRAADAAKKDAAPITPSGTQPPNKSGEPKLPIDRINDYYQMINARGKAKKKELPKGTDTSIRKMPPLMDTFAALSKADEATLVPRGAVVNEGSRSGITVSREFPRGKKLMNNDEFFKKYASDIVIIKGKMSKDYEVEISEKVSQDNIKVIIVVDEKNIPAFKVKKLAK
jgi:hypothetical protein